MKTTRVIGVALLMLAALSSCFWIGYLCGMRSAPLEAGSSPSADLRVISAVYGSGTKFADVTDRVNDLVHQPSVEFGARPSWLKADPNPGWNKALVIVYEFKGQRLTFATGEGGKVSLARLMERLPRTGVPSLVPAQDP